MFVNTTPHEIVIYDEKDKTTQIKKIPASRLQIRLKSTAQEFKTNIDEIPIWTAQKFTGLEVLYDNNPISNSQMMEYNRNLFIVSLPVKMYIDENHKDVKHLYFTVDSNLGCVRENGVIKGTTRLLC